MLECLRFGICLKEIEEKRKLQLEELDQTDEIWANKRKIDVLTSKHIENEKRIYELRFVKTQASTEVNKVHEREKRLNIVRILLIGTNNLRRDSGP